MTVTVKHAKTNAISDWTQAQLDEQIALGNFAEGTVLADIVLPSDWNNDHTLTGVGTMAEQDANNVAITGGTATLSSVTTPSVTATTNNLTLSAISTGKINLNTATANQVQITDATAANGQYTLLSRDNTNNEQRISANASSSGVNFGISSAVAGSIKFYTNGFTELQAQVARTASAVNYVQVTGAATGSSPTISMQGSDSLIALGIRAKGNGDIFFQNNASAGTSLVLSGVTSGVNYHQLTNSAAGLAPTYRMVGTDTNISMAFQPKGTGAINLAAGSSGVNISNGGTVTAITRTAQGTGYTTLTGLTWSASAPTTAGGVTATGTVTTLGGVSATIVNGGTGYTAGNVLTVSGGTFSSASTITVNAVSGGVITSATLTNGGTYTVVPSNPVSVTGGSGTGATFNVSYGVLGLAIGTAGSGYIEQPTITFSGGGGSGAAAYATVGSNTVVRGLGSNLSIFTPGGEQFRVSDTAGSNQYIVATGSSTGNVSLNFSGAGTGGFSYVANSGAHRFWSSGATEQFRVSHTASAVNYVQVSGRATGNGPQITAQGSDTNINFEIQSKGVGNVRLFTGSGEQFRVIHTAGTIVNYAGATGSATGVAPAFSVAGTDTNIDLALTPKGTGLVRFGTYVAGALTATGYINIKAADGTTYKVLVST